MGQRHNVNGNAFLEKPMSMSNNNVNVEGTYTRAKQVDMTVEKLEARLNSSPQSRPFLCKATWRLSEAKLWINCEKAMTGKNPMGLFIWLCKKDGV